MDQTVNAWDDLSKCTESSHGNNFSGNYAANFVISLENFPRIVLGFLVAQGDLFVFNVDVFYVYIQNVANFNNIGRMFDSQPGQFRDVNHAVYAAQINECTVAGDGFNNTLITFANFNFAPEFVFQNFLLLFEDYEINFLFEQLFEWFVFGNTGQGSWDEYFNAFSNSQDAAFYNVSNSTGENFAGASSSHNLFKASLSIQTFFGQHNCTFNVVYAQNNQFDFIAFFHDIFGGKAWIVCQLGKWNITCVFGTDVNGDLVWSNTGNDTFHLLPCICTLEGLIQHLFKGHFLFF